MFFCVLVAWLIHHFGPDLNTSKQTIFWFMTKYFQNYSGIRVSVTSASCLVLQISQCKSEITSKYQHHLQIADANVD